MKEFWIHKDDIGYSICTEDSIYEYAQDLKEAESKLKSISEKFNGVCVQETESKAKQLLKMLEMARVGTYDNHLIYIYSESLANPSFHVKYKDEWEVVLQIKDLSILEVKNGSFKKGNQLPNREKKSLIEYLESKMRGSDLTIWHYLLVTWNLNNEQYEIPTDTPLPK